jgi:hypothetical protein
VLRIIEAESRQLGIPRFCGGPMFHAQLMGDEAVQATLDRLAREHGATFWS